MALTKVDMVEPDWLDLVREDLEEYLHGSFLEEPRSSRSRASPGPVCRS